MGSFFKLILHTLPGRKVLIRGIIGVHHHNVQKTNSWQEVKLGSKVAYTSSAKKLIP